MWHVLFGLWLFGDLTLVYVSHCIIASLPLFSCVIYQSNLLVPKSYAFSCLFAHSVLTLLLFFTHFILFIFILQFSACLLNEAFSDCQTRFDSSALCTHCTFNELQRSTEHISQRLLVFLLHLTELCKGSVQFCLLLYPQHLASCQIHGK